MGREVKLADDFVSPEDDGFWDGDAQSLCRFEVDHEIKLGRLFDRRIRNDYVDFCMNQIRSNLRCPGASAVGGSPLEHHIAPLAVAGFAQTLSKGLRLPPLG